MKGKRVWAFAVVVLGVSCQSPRKNVAVSELIGTYVATWKDPPDAFELRKNGKYRHVSGPRSLVSEGTWEATTENGRTIVSFRDFLLNWPRDVPGAGEISGWATFAEVPSDGVVRIVIPGSPYSYVKQAIGTSRD